jgi:methyltransferase (TIGR00027 family)
MNQDKPSATALLIAKSQLLLAADPLLTGTVDTARANYYRSFVEAVIGAPWHLNLINRHWLKFTECISIPGMYLHYALRKRCIEQVTREFLDSAQIQQVVVIAGGFDPLLAMLSEQYKNMAFFELDHPATQRAKKAALHNANNLTLLPIDLTRQSVSDVLHGSSFSPDKSTLFIAEGITMYLDEQEIKRFFQQIQSCTRHDDSHFLFTYMNKQPSGSIQFESATKLVDYWLWVKKEVFKWGIATGELAGFLSAIGYRLVSVFDADYLTQQYLADKNMPLARGENICLARVKC